MVKKLTLDCRLDCLIAAFAECKIKTVQRLVLRRFLDFLGDL